LSFHAAWECQYFNFVACNAAGAQDSLWTRSRVVDVGVGRVLCSSRKAKPQLSISALMEGPKAATHTQAPEVGIGSHSSLKKAGGNF
jgi:hypothetical protein